MPSQYYNTYLLEEVGMSYTYLNFVVIFSIVSVIALTPAWKKLIDKYKLRNITFWSIFLSIFCYAGLAYVSESLLILYPISYFYAYIFAVGLNICLSIIPFENLPEKNRTFYLALFNTGVTLVVFLGNFIGRVIYNVLLLFNDLALAPAQILMLLTGILLGASAFLIYRLFGNQEKSV